MYGEMWAIVLAAGDGKRLKAIATDSRGICVPKQFLAFGRKQSLLRTTVERARALVAPGRVVPVVAASHEEWWRPDLDPVSLKNVVVQPRNVGTAPGVLLPVLQILQRDPAATLLILPSDHHVEDEDLFRDHLRQLVGAAREDASRVILLGMEASSSETEYGWILPSALSDGLTHAVDSFVEKPTSAHAEALFLDGGLWSTLAMAGSAAAMEDLFERATPALAWQFLSAQAGSHAPGSERLSSLYDTLQPTDFSRDVLQQPTCRGRLRVLPARSCGWSDLGTPERIASALGAHAVQSLTSRSLGADSQ